MYKFLPITPLVNAKKVLKKHIKIKRVLLLFIFIKLIVKIILSK